MIAIIVRVVAITWVVNAYTEVWLAAGANAEAEAEAGVCVSCCRKADGQSGGGGEGDQCLFHNHYPFVWLVEESFGLDVALMERAA